MTMLEEIAFLPVNPFNFIKSPRQLLVKFGWLSHFDDTRYVLGVKIFKIKSDLKRKDCFGYHNDVCPFRFDPRAKTSAVLTFISAKN